MTDHILRTIARRGKYHGNYPVTREVTKFLRDHPEYELVRVREAGLITGLPVKGAFGRVEGWGGTEADPGSFEIVPAKGGH